MFEIIEEKLKILIIGYGSIGRRHARILKDLDPTMQIDLVTKQQVSGFHTFSDLKTVREIETYDLFLIASETFKHLEQLTYLEERVSNKRILVEKPLFSEYRLLEEPKNQIFVAYNLRFDPILQNLKEWIRNEHVVAVLIRVGQYLPTWRPGTDYRKSYSASSEAGGGVLLDLSHELDYIHWLFGDLQSFHAINTKISDLEISSDDYLSLIGTTNRGIQINLNMDYISKIGMRQIVVHTNNATIVADLVENHLRKKTKEGLEEKMDLPIKDGDRSYLAMHQAILREDSTSTCKFQEGLVLMELIERIRKLAKR